MKLKTQIYFLLALTLFLMAPKLMNADDLPQEVDEYTKRVAASIQASTQKSDPSFKLEDQAFRKKYDDDPTIIHLLDHWKNKYIKAFGKFE